MGLTPDQQLLRQEDREFADAMTLAAELRDRRAFHRLVPDRFPELNNPVGRLLLNTYALTAVQGLEVDLLQREREIADPHRVFVIALVRAHLKNEENALIDCFEQIVPDAFGTDSKEQVEKMKLRGYLPHDSYLKNFAFLEESGAPEAMDPDTMAFARVLPPVKLTRRQIAGAVRDITMWDEDVEKALRLLMGKRPGYDHSVEDQSPELTGRYERYRQVINTERQAAYDHLERLFDKLARQVTGELEETKNPARGEPSDFSYYGEGTA